MAQAALRQLLERAVRRQETEALALLDHRPRLINARWEGRTFVIEDELDGTKKSCNLRTTVIIAAAKGGDLALVHALLERGADPHARDQSLWTASMAAAFWAHVEICEMLYLRGADLFAVNTLGKNALDLFGGSRLSEEEKEAGRQRLRVAWANGAHPSQVQRRRDERWARRWPFMQVMVLGGFQPLAARLAALKETALPPDVELPRPPCDTPALRLGLLRAKVFSHPGIWRTIAAFL